jgi:hypothetical protein
LEAGKLTKENELTKVPHAILEEAQKAGIESDDKKRSGTFFHVNQETVQATVNHSFSKEKLSLWILRLP